MPFGLASLIMPDIRTQQKAIASSLDNIADAIRHDQDQSRQLDQLKHRNWFEEPAALIALAAFILSFATTAVSYKHTIDQDNHNLRSELRSILQRVDNIALDGIKTEDSAHGDIDKINFIRGLFAQENRTLALQAYNIVLQLDDEQITTSDCVAVAAALERGSDFAKALKIVRIADRLSITLEDQVNAKIRMSVMMMRTGHIDEGRRGFENIRNTIQHDFSATDYIKLGFIINAYVAQGHAEVDAGNFEKAKECASNAKHLSLTLKNAQARGAAAGDVANLETQINGLSP